MQMKNEAAAADDLQKALALDPNFMQAQAGPDRTGDGARAMPTRRWRWRARSRKARTSRPIGYLIEGDILVSQKKPELAIRAV